MIWSQRLTRVFGIEIDTGARCGGNLKVIASIEEPQVIVRILAHLERTTPDHSQAELPLGARAPPASGGIRAPCSARGVQDGRRLADNAFKAAALSAAAVPVRRWLRCGAKTL
jgi:hypothetical protein